MWPATCKCHLIPTYPDPEELLGRAQEDVHAVLQAGADYGAERLAHTADTQMGRLDPAEYLNPGTGSAASSPAPDMPPSSWREVCNLSERQQRL